MHVDFIRGSGSAFLAHRFKRLADRIVTEVGSVLQELDLTVPPTAGSTLSLLATEAQLGVMEIAERLRVTHPFIVRLVAKLETLGLVQVRGDPRDLRRKAVSLTARGQREAEQLKRLNDALERSFGEIADETGVSALEVVNLFEAALLRRPLGERINRNLEVEKN